MRPFLAVLFLCLAWPAEAQFGLSARDVTHVVASWYDCVRPGQCSKSKRTANGERFDPNAMTSAHRTLPFGTKARVCRKGCVIIRINDRGPFIKGRSLDLSRAAARAIGLAGVGRVSLEIL
jgi:rare lipoprotein A